jgi:hypothetical protein
LVSWVDRRHEPWRAREQGEKSLLTFGGSSLGWKCSAALPAIQLRKRHPCMSNLGVKAGEATPGDSEQRLEV